MEHQVSSESNQGIWLHTNKHHLNFDNKNALPPRVNHGQAYDEKTKNLYIIGGFYEFNEGNKAISSSTIDIQCINMLTLQNKQLISSKNISKDIENLDKLYQEKWISLEYRENEYWKYKSDLLNVPFARYGLAATFMNGKVYIYGGHNDNNKMK